MRANRSSSDSREGFTLVELMVVVTIIGIMTAAIIPEMKGSFQDALLRSASRELIGVFDLAGSRAVSLHQVRRVRLDETSGRYRVEKQARPDAEDEFAPVDDVPGSSGQLDSRIVLEFYRAGEDPAEDNAPAGNPAAEAGRSQVAAVVFYPDGTADGGSILLRDRQGFRLLLRVNPVTARVRVTEMERKGLP